MKKIFVVTMFAAVLCSQTAPPPSSGGPVVGFLNGPAPLNVTPILGIASAAHLSAAVAAPEGVSAVYLPPRQQYALVEQSTAVPISIWNLQSSDHAHITQSITGALSHADYVAFSPRGTSAALYSDSQSRLQVLTGLPGMACVSADVSTQTLGRPINLAVADDGAVVVAATASAQSSVWSGGNAWRLLPWNYSPLAWSFVSDSHDLLLSQAATPGLLLFRDIAGPNSPPAILASGASPDLISSASDGGYVVLADSTHHLLSTVELQTGTVRSVPSPSSRPSLVTLRDGHTFFISQTSSTFSLLKVPAASAEPQLLTHPASSQAISKESTQ